MNQTRRDFLLKGSLVAGAAVTGGCSTPPSVDPEPMAMTQATPIARSVTWAYQKDAVKFQYAGYRHCPLKFWVIGDTHFAWRDARDDQYADFYKRMGQWGSSKEPFEKMLKDAQAAKVDQLVLVGDIISFPTLANVEYVKQALDASGIPWIYVAGNHDWHFEGDEGSDLEQRARWTKKRLLPLYQGENPLCYSRVVKGVRLVMMDNSAYHVLPEQVAFWKREAAKGDPMCLFMHIPFWQPGWSVTTCACPTWGAKTDPYWQIERRRQWDKCLMPSTFEFRKAVLATQNLVGVFAGHIHILQVASECDHALFSVPSNRKGQHLAVTIGG